MSEETWQLLDALFQRHPVLVAGPAPVEEVNAATALLGMPLPVDLREFICRYGGAMVGAYPILGVRQAEVMGEGAWSIVEVNRRYQSEGWPHVSEWLVFTIDLAGNPVGLAPDGTVWEYDHDFGGVSRVAQSFEGFLREEALGAGQ